MKKTFNTPEDFYKNAMTNVLQIIENKLKILGVNPMDLPYLVNERKLNKYTSDEIDGVVLEMYEYKGIRLAEFEWTGNGIKQRDINKDEREIRKGQVGIL